MKAPTIDGWLTALDYLTPIDKATPEVAAAAEMRSKRREAEALNAEQAKHVAAFDAWAAALDAALGTANDAPALAAARRALAAAEATVAEIAAVLVEQRRELARLENATVAKLEGATVADLAKIAKNRGVATAELDTLRAVVAELERRHTAAVADRDQAAQNVAALATIRLHQHLNELVFKLKDVWVREIWPVYEDICKTQDLIVQRGGAGEGRIWREGFRRLHKHLEAITNEAATWPGRVA